MKHNVFNQLITQEQAYWLGFLAADGSIYKTKLEIGLAERDSEHLIKLREFLGAADELGITYSQITNQTGKTYQAAYLTIRSADIVLALEQYDIVQQKSLIDTDFFSNIPEEFQMSFLFGLFDGDGWFTHKTTTNFGICGNKITAERFKAVLEKNGIVTSSAQILAYTNSPNTFYFSDSKNHDIIAFCEEYLKANEYLPLLNRKVEVAKQILLDIHDKYLKIEEHKRQLEQDKTIICPICNKSFIKSFAGQIYCSQECVHKSQQVTERPSKEELKRLIRTTSFLKIGEQYGVSDNAIRKWCDAYGLPRKKTDINKISDEEWNKI